MLILTIYGSGGTPQSYDLHQPLPDGTMTQKLPAADLYRQLKKLGIRDIAVTMGWQDLAFAYARWRQKNPADPPTDHRDDAA